MRLFPAILVSLTFVAPHTLPAQTAALHSLLHDMFEDQLKRTPEFASAIGDPRYNDQLSDLSPSAFNDGIAAEQGFLQRILMIDPSGLSQDDKLAADNIQNELTADLEAAKAKPWELPVTPTYAIQGDLAALAANSRFATVKDYDDYIARLHLVPRQLRQASEDLLAGIDDHRVEPAGVIETALKQAEELAGQTPEASPFALPVQKFPAAVPAASRKRISAELLDAIETDVLPAYARFAKFLRVAELPAAQKEHAAIPDAPLTTQAAQRHIIELRDRARSALGARFDLKGFHDLIEGSWALPPERLDSHVDAWIAARK